MRLIDCHSLPLRMELFATDPPPFAILSHTWGSQEVTLQDFENIDSRRAMQGWDKVEKTCAHALEHGCRYVWIDSCCIDKKNQPETAKSINSMFQWYQDAAVCLVYLADVDADDMSTLYRSRWFTRGWTLQETIAPRDAYFYDATWRWFGTRESHINVLLSATGIDRSILVRSPSADVHDLLRYIPVACRMSWAARRETTEPEDMAYCLIGLFGVNMPPLYGEGAEQAFVRLQEEIIRDNNDLSLFAWAQPEPPSGPQDMANLYRGILARSPAEFKDAGDLALDHDLKFNPDYAMSNKGLRIHTFLYTIPGSEHVFMPLHCHRRRLDGQPSPPLGLYLMHDAASVYFRVNPHTQATLAKRTPSSSDGNDIFVSKRSKSRAPPVLAPSNNVLSKVYFQVQGLENAAEIRLTETVPRELWDAQNRVFVTRGLRSFTAFHRFQLIDNYTGDCIVACGWSDEARDPWVLVEDQLGSLYPAANVKDLQTTAQLGAQLGSLKARKQDLYMHMAESSTWRARIGVAKLSCEQRVHAGEPILVVSLDLKKNHAVAPTLYNKWI